MKERVSDTMAPKTTYEQERDFDKTPEPRFKKKKSASDEDPDFVIHKHDAQQLHYDFRLEIDGVLKSWVLPKGPSLNPSQKRLAIPVEDHPVGYAGFEGVIPEDQYGGGTVMIWDRGKYQNNRSDISLKQSYEEGKIEINLNGEKISGGFALVKTDGMDGNWLLIKKDDDTADDRRDPVRTQHESVVSGRSLKEIENQEK